MQPLEMAQEFVAYSKNKSRGLSKTLVAAGAESCDATTGRAGGAAASDLTAWVEDVNAACCMQSGINVCRDGSAVPWVCNADCKLAGPALLGLRRQYSTVQSDSWPAGFMACCVGCSSSPQVHPMSPRWYASHSCSY